MNMCASPRKMTTSAARLGSGYHAPGSWCDYRTVIMTLSQIRDFVAVVEAGGIRAAARKLGVSQPAITRSVRSLEAELPAPLVRSTTTEVVPTPPGRAFFATPRAAQAKLRKTKKEVD